MSIARITPPVSPLEINPRNIWMIKQNKLKYVEQDLLDLWGVPTSITRTVLRARGIEKWMGNRKLFIELKSRLKDSIVNLNTQIPKLKGAERARAVGQMEGMVVARQAIRAICHSPRWRPETE